MHWQPSQLIIVYLTRWMFDRFSGLIQQKPIWWGARLDELVRNTKIIKNTYNFSRWIRSLYRTYCIDDVLYIHMLMRGQDSQEHFFEVTWKKFNMERSFFCIILLKQMLLSCRTLKQPESTSWASPTSTLFREKKVKNICWCDHDSGVTYFMKELNRKWARWFYIRENRTLRCSKSD